MKTDTALWQAINAYDIGATDAILPFSRRLARDNGWSPDFASRAIAEYKRFVYLACVSGHTVTPSEEVDAVWHLHLMYTRDYWDRFCGATLNRRIHHSPSFGGQAETETYRDAYQRTLTLYEAEFGAPPPADIWPGEAIRFSPQTVQTIDTRTHVILPKRQVFSRLGLASVLALAGCKMVEHSPILPWTIFALIVAATVILNFAAIRRFGAINYTITGGLLSFAGAWFFGDKLAQGLSVASGLPVGIETGQAAVASAIAVVFTWLYAMQKPGSGGNCSSSGCGGGCGSSCGGGCGGD